MFSIVRNHKGSINTLLALMPFLICTAVLGAQRYQAAVMRTAQIQKTTAVKNQMVSIKNWLITNASDVDVDSYAELPKENTGNTLPLSCPVKSTDENGKPIKYETWDLGVTNTNPAYSQNNTSPPKPGMIGRLTAAGNDMIQGTADDIVYEIYNSDVP